MKALIKSRPVSFRRAGIEFNRTGREIDLGALSKDQVAAIYAEPNLEVTLLELPKKAAKVTPPVKSDTGKASPAGGEPQAGAGAPNNPASESGTQGADGGGDAGNLSASTSGTAITTPGVETPDGGKPPTGSGNQGADGAISNPGSAAPAAKPAKPAAKPAKAKATP